MYSTWQSFNQAFLVDSPLLSYIDVRHSNFLPSKFTVGKAQDLGWHCTCSNELAPIKDESAELASRRLRELAYEAIQQEEPAAHAAIESNNSSRTHPAHDEEMVPTRLCQLVSLFLVHVKPHSSSHLRGVVRLLPPILLPLLPSHDLAKDHKLQNRHLPALTTLKPKPLLNHPRVLPSMNPLPRSGHMWRLPPDQYWHGNLILS